MDEVTSPAERNLMQGLVTSCIAICTSKNRQIYVCDFQISESRLPTTSLLDHSYLNWSHFHSSLGNRAKAEAIDPPTIQLDYLHRQPRALEISQVPFFSCNRLRPASSLYIGKCSIAVFRQGSEFVFICYFRFIGLFECEPDNCNDQ